MQLSRLRAGTLSSEPKIARRTNAADVTTENIAQLRRVTYVGVGTVTVRCVSGVVRVRRRRQQERG